jgi:hypothetical protein
MSPHARSVRRLALAASLALAPGAAGAQVSVTIFSGFVAVGGGAPFSSPICSFGAPAVDFATAVGYEWKPCGLPDDAEFGALITGVFDVVAPGLFPIGLSSDDGSRLFIDGALAIDNGGTHGPITTTVPIAFPVGGLHPFAIEFFECCAGPSGVELILTPDVTYGSSAAVPEPATLALTLGGVLALAPLARRRRQR